MFLKHQQLPDSADRALPCHHGEAFDVWPAEEGGGAYLLLADGKRKDFSSRMEAIWFAHGALKPKPETPHRENNVS